MLVSILTSTFTFVGIVLLYRQLESEDAGLITLILAVVQVGVMTAGLGQATLVQRLYSQAAAGEFDWIHDLLFTILMGIPVLGLLLVAATLGYHLSPGHSVVILSLVVFQGAIQT